MAIDPSLVETVPCPLCGETRTKVVRLARYPENVSREELLKVYSSSSDDGLMDQLVRCKACSLLYLNPRIKASIIMNSYQSAIDPVFFDQNPMRIKTFDRCFRNLLKSYSIKSDSSKTVLDVGCAGGAFLKAATDLGFSGVGVEPSAWLCEQGRLRYGLDLRAGDLTQQTFTPGSLFMVTLWDVLEHLTQPGAILDQIHAILAQDGYLILNLPNSESLVSRLMGNHWPFLLNVHLTYFTPTTLEEMLKRHGFRLLSVRPYFQTLEFGYVLQRASQITPLFKPFKNAVDLLGLGHCPFFYNMGQMTAVARKA